jgi:asparagine synthase (glutamine-hydrolysing)
MGFGVPIDLWLAGPLREWAEQLLCPKRLEREGFFNSVALAERWRSYQRGSRRWHGLLWTVLMFQAWLDSQ